jgi:hypothetical protein
LAQVRSQIYAYLSPTDILSLRSTDRDFRKDINTCRGVHLRLNDSLTSFEWVKHLGLEAITIDQLNENVTDSSEIISNPSLLKRLIIRGTATPENLILLLNSCKFLERFEVECTHLNVRLQPSLFVRSLPIPEGLNEIRITSYTDNRGDSIVVLQNVKCLLLQCKGCETLQKFYLSIILLGPNNEEIDECHLFALKFIRSHASSLKKVEIQIKQLLLDPGQLNRLWLREDLEYHAWTGQLKLDELNVNVDR